VVFSDLIVVPKTKMATPSIACVLCQHARISNSGNPTSNLKEEIKGFGASMI
jgi:hypothetical protein